jgi:CRP-like cAMP-binding protein
LLEQLYLGRSLNPYPVGAILSLQVEEIAIVCRGVVQLSTIHENGDETLLGLVGPSMPIGLPLTAIDSYQAIALTPVDILRLSIQEIEASDVLAAGLYRQLVSRLKQAESWLALSGERPVSERLRSLLTLLAQEFGQVGTDGIYISIRLTHLQLANAIGATRVTVTRLLQDFRARGWLSLNAQRHLVVKPDLTNRDI